MATIKYWNGSAWELAIVGKQGPVGPTGPTGPAGQASLQRFRYVATGGQTSVSGTDANGNTLAYTPGLEEVFINGAAQVRGQDYTATNGTSITGITALIAGDVVEIYAWGVFNVANTISNTLIDAKGDILAGTAADTVSRLAVGANDTVLTADSSTATGLKWATPAGGETAFTLLNAGGTALTGAATITVSGITKNTIFVLVAGASSANAQASIRLRINSDSTSKYNTNGLQIRQSSTYSGSGFGSTVNGYNETLDGNSYFQIGDLSGSATSTLSGYIQIFGAKSTGPKVLNGVGGCEPASTGSDAKAAAVGGIYTGTSAVSSISLISSTGNFDAGTLYVYEG